MGAYYILTVVGAIEFIRAVAAVHEAVALLGSQNTERGVKVGFKLIPPV